MTATKAAVARAQKASKTGSARAINKAARRERQAEIEARWSDRTIVRSFAEMTQGKDAYEVLDTLISYGHVCDREKLLAGTRFSIEGYRVLASVMARVIELKEMPYDEYLQTPEWQERASKAKRHYNGCCALDDSHLAEHAHHRTYERRGREWDTDLVALCADCHARFHGKTPR